MNDDSQPHEDAVATVTTHGSQPRRMDASDLAETGVVAPRQAQTYVLRRVEDLDRHETADRLEITASTVDDNLRAAESHLADALEAAALLRGEPLETDAHEIVRHPTA
jgi:DNA-directed RNA polymerase specialized sigma24 family protein